MNDEDLDRVWDRTGEAEEVPAPLRPEDSLQTTDDLLGLNSDIKVITRVKRIKLDNTRLLDDENNGLNYIRKNYHKVKFTSRKHPLSRVTRRSVQETPEFVNLTRLLAFYQLWAHQLFPRANFQEFIETLQVSERLNFKLREARHAWIDFEAEGGFKGVPSNPDDTLFFDSLEGMFLTTSTSNAPALLSADPQAPDLQAGNSLFVGADSDDDLYHTPQTTTLSGNNHPTAPSPPTATVTANPIFGNDEFDDWSDQDDPVPTAPGAVADDDAVAALEAEAREAEPDYDDEMDVLREMGM